MSSIANGLNDSSYQFHRKSALRGLGGFWRTARGGIRVRVGLIDAAAEDRLVWVGLFLVHPDITDSKTSSGARSFMKRPRIRRMANVMKASQTMMVSAAHDWIRICAG